MALLDGETYEEALARQQANEEAILATVASIEASKVASTPESVEVVSNELTELSGDVPPVEPEAPPVVEPKVPVKKSKKK